jgi:hypothetical protein
VKLAQLAGYNRNPSVIEERHEKFVAKELPLTEQAYEFGQRELARLLLPRHGDRDRRRSFSASSLGSCGRQQQFTFLGMPQMPMSGQRRAVLLNGTFVGIRQQMVGISEGYLREAEVPIPPNDFGLKGTMDGVHEDGDHLIEYKSQNDRGFQRLKWDKEPKEGHVFQVGTYLAITGMDKAVILYENKNDQSVKEFIVERDDKVEEQVLTKAHMLEDSTDAEVLLPMLEPCKEKKGWEYDYCDYKDRCPLIKDWAQAKEMADA